MNNKIKVLDLETQISILKQAKTKLEKFGCLCGAIGEIINKKGICHGAIAFINIHNFIPLFTYANAIIACKEKHVKIPKGKVYWWRIDNLVSRRAMLNWMIEQLENSK